MEVRTGYLSVEFNYADIPKASRAAPSIPATVAQFALQKLRLFGMTAKSPPMNRR